MLTAKKVETRYYRLLYFMMLFTLLCFAIGVEQFFFVIPIALLITIGYFLRLPLLSQKSEPVIACLLLLTFVFIHALTKDVLLSAGGMLVGLYILFFFLKERENQHSSVHLLAILGVMMVATFLIDRLYYVFLFAIFAFLTVLLLFYHLLFHQQKRFSKHLEKWQTQSYPQYLSKSKDRGKRFLYKTAIVAFLLLATSSIFMVIPRINWDPIGSRSMNLGKTGFSKEMESSTVARLLSDPNVFFFVNTTHRQNDYFTGVIYDEYQKTKWETTLPMETISRHPLQHKFVLTEEPVKEIRPEKFEIYHYEGVCVFYRDVPISLRFSKWNMNHSLKVDKAGNLNTIFPMEKKLSYTIEVGKYAKETPLDEEVAWAYENYLQLPELSPRVKNLAKKLTKDAKNNREKAYLIQDHLQKNYTYTLNMGTFEHEMADYFLFEAQEGYCLHFATAMTVMLRLQGIPARLVGGFRASAYDHERGGFVVTNEDAHAWVEVFFSGTGWQRFDPTPPQEDYLSGLEFWKRLYYRLQTFWARYVVGFSRSHQSGILYIIKESVQWLILNRRLLLYLLLSMVLLKLLLFIGRKEWSGKEKLQRILPLRSNKNPLYRQALIANTTYRRMVDLLKKVHLLREPGETPLEFAAKTKQSFPNLYPYVAPITHYFCQVRFAHHVATAEEQKDVEKRVKDLENSIKNLQNQTISVARSKS